MKLFTLFFVLSLIFLSLIVPLVRSIASPNILLSLAEGLLISCLVGICIMIALLLTIIVKRSE
ncbi:hypothetical protein MALU111345_18940 [Marinicrinis lubricantis]